VGFVLDNKYVAKLVLGVENFSQLKGNIDSSEFRTLPDFDVESIPEEVLMPMCWPN
jgi:aryl-alcohol dehydrogenase-like predicted oxidoreductase